MTWELGPYGWHPDGRSLVTARSREGATNLWRTPLDGGGPEQLTRFDAGNVIDFDWSPEGDWLFVTHGPYSSDAVRIRGFR